MKHGSYGKHGRPASPYKGRGFSQQSPHHISQEPVAPRSMQTQPMVKKPKAKGLKKVAKVCLIVVAIVMLLMIGAGAFALHWISALDGSMNVGESEELNEVLKGPAKEEESAFYMLLLGSDAREGESYSRSDVNMLVRVDPEVGSVCLVSIPRDTMVDIPGYGTQKINAAYAFNGPVGAITTVSDFAGVDIRHYAEIHFDELIELVDLLGGVEVNVSEPMYSWTDGVEIPAGVQTLSGGQALDYARDRHSMAGGDYSRAQAQRQIVEAILTKVTKMSVTELPAFIEEAADCVSTDLSIKDLIGLGLKFNSTGVNVYSSVCPSYSFMQDGVSYTGTMYNEWKTLMQRMDAGLDPEDETATIPDEQLNNERLGSAENAMSPRDYDPENAGLTTDDVIKVD